MIKVLEMKKMCKVPSKNVEGKRGIQNKKAFARMIGKGFQS